MNNSDYLIHHGIMGMKWGVRRYQNKDGSLTSTGKSRKSRTYTDRDRKRDKFNYGKRTQKRIEKNLEIPDELYSEMKAKGLTDEECEKLSQSSFNSQFLSYFLIRIYY